MDNDKTPSQMLRSAAHAYLSDLTSADVARFEMDRRNGLQRSEYHDFLVSLSYYSASVLPATDPIKEAFQNLRMEEWKFVANHWGPTRVFHFRKWLNTLSDAERAQFFVSFFDAMDEVLS